jgi:hypothetical protein
MKISTLIYLLFVCNHMELTQRPFCLDFGKGRSVCNLSFVIFIYSNSDNILVLKFL